MTDRIRKGFTLVELLAVIVIISMLVALLIPAVSSARARARQTQCMNNQHNVGLALLQYESRKRHFPGYLNKMGTGKPNAASMPMPLSWATVIFPYMDNEAAWRDWRQLRTDKTDKGNPPPELLVQVPAYVCPSDSLALQESDSLALQEKAALSYAVNCGRRDNANVQPPDTPDTAANGVFHNRYDFSTPEVSASSIRDGASQTILFSENIQAGHWYVSPTELGVAEFDLGITWDRDETPAPPRLINGCREGCPPTHGNPGTRPKDPLFARPSSNHPGGVVVTYCDGHQQFLSDRIYYITYQHLMTPDSDKAGLPAAPQDPEWQQ